MNVSKILRAAIKVCGFCLVMVAMTSVAQARTPAPPSGVPEIDPGSLLSAMTLLSGGLMMIVDRRRRAN